MVTIYLITNRVTGKYYVGQTSLDVRERFKKHVYDAKRGEGCRKLCGSLRKHGAHNFIVEELATTTKEEAENLEKLWIVALDARNPKVGYNLSLGGKAPRGYKWSPESCSNLSEKMKGNTRVAGIPKSEEHKAKISATLMGHPQSPNKGSFKAGMKPWNTGKEFSSETRARMSAAKKGKRINPATEFKPGMVPWNKGLKGA
jgi:group I intron endonuclease